MTPAQTGDLNSLANLAHAMLYLGLMIVATGCFIGLVGLRVVGSRLRPEVALEWLQRWVSLTTLERWTILWTFTRMDKEEKKIFKTLWIQLDCRIYKEFGGLQNFMLSAFGGGWLIAEMARAINHQGWMTGIPYPSEMPIEERPTTFVQVVCSDFSKKVFILGLLVALIGGIGEVVISKILVA